VWRGAAPGEPPITANDTVTLALFKPFSLPTDPVEQPLAGELRKLAARVDYFEFDAEPSEALARQCSHQASASDKVVVAVIAKPAAWHAFGLTPAQQALAMRLAERGNAVVAALGVDAALDAFPDRLARLCAFSDVPASQAAVAEALGGVRA
ncbi:MAG: hypothetical protein KDA37_08395, partial [Planctomycetales bacterium]|nr:hypothetical protein [Planctomycetales bacterium]